MLYIWGFFHSAAEMQAFPCQQGRWMSARVPKGPSRTSPRRRTRLSGPLRVPGSDASTGGRSKLRPPGLAQLACKSISLSNCANSPGGLAIVPRRNTPAPRASCLAREARDNHERRTGVILTCHRALVRTLTAS